MLLRLSPNQNRFLVGIVNTLPLESRSVPTKSTACRVLSDLDIYRAANLLIQRHGRDAAVEAGRLLDLMLDQGDMEGRPVWLRIRRAIVQLQAMQIGPTQ